MDKIGIIIVNGMIGLAIVIMLISIRIELTRIADALTAAERQK